MSVETNLTYALEWAASDVHVHGFHLYDRSLTLLVEEDANAARSLLAAADLMDGGVEFRSQPYEHDSVRAQILSVAGEYRGVFTSAQATFTRPDDLDLILSMPASRHLLEALAGDPVPVLDKFGGAV